MSSSLAAEPSENLKVNDGQADQPVSNDASDERTYLQQLFAAGLLVPTGVDGLYGRSAIFEDVVERISDLIGAWGDDKPVEVLRFPPAMSRQVLEESGYWANFPTQIGSVFSFCGDDRSHQRLLKCLDNQEDWTEDVKPTQLTLTPVACYPVYPVMAARGPLPEGGRLVDIFSYCCRHEPSLDPERMTMFRQREFVRMGTPTEILEFRDDWMAHAKVMMTSLGLPWTIAVANDPFFGRGGRIMADSQRQQELKFELLVPVINPNRPTALGSFNYHRDRFSSLWHIEAHDGEIAHTGCCGFGLERIALSLFKLHGLAPDAWPASVRTALWGAKRV
ncbi:MAG: amino acid--[acyl-carrier-protein] ligase [Janthinobacterium lividum]